MARNSWWFNTQMRWHSRSAQQPLSYGHHSLNCAVTLWAIHHFLSFVVTVWDTGIILWATGTASSTGITWTTGVNIRAAGFHSLSYANVTLWAPVVSLWAQTTPNNQRRTDRFYDETNNDRTYCDKTSKDIMYNDKRYKRDNTYNDKTYKKTKGITTKRIMTKGIKRQNI